MKRIELCRWHWMCSVEALSLPSFVRRTRLISGSGFSLLLTADAAIANEKQKQSGNKNSAATAVLFQLQQTLEHYLDS